MRLTLLLFILLSITSISISHACDPWIGSPPPLSSKMKELLIGNRAINTYQQNLNGEITNIFLSIPWETEQGGRHIPGQALTISMLNGARGWAEVSFVLSVPPNQLSIVKNLVSSRYPLSQKAISIDAVYGTIGLYSKSNKKLASEQYEFSNGQNIIEFCNYNQIKEDVEYVLISPYSVKLSLSEHLLLQ